jgi:membrane protease YdiL (CAAX protease family)
VVWYIVRQASVPLRSIGLVRPRRSDAVIGGVLFFLAFGAWVAMSSWIHVESPDAGSAWPAAPRDVIGICSTVIVVLVGVFAEELICRGYLIARIEAATASLPLAIVLSAALFASYHLYQGFRSTVSVFVTGCLYGLGFAMTRRLWPGVAAHAAWNLWVILGSSFGDGNA